MRLSGAGLARGGCAVLLGVGLLAGLRTVPAGEATAWLRGTLPGGFAGLLLFGLIYVVAALLLVPGAALTLAGGALFGPVEGLVVVSLASTTAAALAFLATRHLARTRVEALAARHRAFRAVDQAVAAGGWRVVALLRLSPAMPFTVENYLFGLTAVRFWPYVAATWLFMLPGSALYISLGHAGRTFASGSSSPAESILLGVGVAATAGVTVYLARAARRALQLEAAAAPTGTRGAAPSLDVLATKGGRS